MTKNFIIPLHIYPFDIMVSIGQSDQELIKIFDKYGIDWNGENKKLWQYETDTVRGRACMFSGNQTLIRLRKKPVTALDYGHLAHEIFHAATFIMWKIGTKLEIEVSDEPYAYLIQYLTEQIYLKIGKRK